jgi:hypothetical protein
MVEDFVVWVGQIAEEELLYKLVDLINHLEKHDQ